MLHEYIERILHLSDVYSACSELKRNPFNRAAALNTSLLYAELILDLLSPHFAQCLPSSLIDEVGSVAVLVCTVEEAEEVSAVIRQHFDARFRSTRDYSIRHLVQYSRRFARH